MNANTQWDFVTRLIPKPMAYNISIVLGTPTPHAIDVYKNRAKPKRLWLYTNPRWLSTQPH